MAVLLVTRTHLLRQLRMLLDCFNKNYHEAASWNCNFRSARTARHQLLNCLWLTLSLKTQSSCLRAMFSCRPGLLRFVLTHWSACWVRCDFSMFYSFSVSCG